MKVVCKTTCLLLCILVCSKLTHQLTKAEESRNQEVNSVFSGPTQCQENKEILGYSNLNKLNQDMYINALDVLSNNVTAQNEYVYTICPHTVFDIDGETARSGTHESIGIFLNNTVIQCGTDEKSFGSCILQGGDVQIVFPPELEVRNAIIKGIIFTGNSGYGVAAYSHPSSDATFIHCTWIENEAIYVIVMYYDPNYSHDARSRKRDLFEAKYNEDDFMNYRQKFSDFVTSISINETPQVERQLTIGYASMSTQFIRCTFSDNVLSGEVINNQGGNLKVIETTFINNIVGYAVIGVAYGGQLSIEGNTHFQDNISPFVPVFVDSDSFLNLNVNNTGSDNLGIVCVDGIFIEKAKDSYCMEGGKCEGDCCSFGDDTCDRYGTTSGEMDPGSPTNDIEGAESSTQSSEEEYALATMKAPESATATYEDKTKTVVGLRVTVILLVIALALVLGLLIFKKKREHAILGNIPDNAFD